jgi:hypothetical protein
MTGKGPRIRAPHEHYVRRDIADGLNERGSHGARVRQVVGNAGHARSGARTRRPFRRGKRRRVGSAEKRTKAASRQRH